MSSYKNTFFLISLFIFFSSANSLIRQVTDDFHTKWQQEEAEAKTVPEVDNGGLNPINREISSSDSTVTGFRDDPPSSYSLTMNSFTTVLNAWGWSSGRTYESHPFTVGGYNWTLIVYPHGNWHENGTGFISMYVAIDQSNLIDPHQEVDADLRFYIYNNNEKKYFTIKDTNVRRFNASKTMLGYSRVIPIDTFTDLNNGYLYDDDQCEFGVDVITPPLVQNSELFNVTRNFQNPIFNWSIQHFSTYSSILPREFTIGERRWSLQIYPRGIGSQQDKSLSVYLSLSKQEKLKLKPNGKIYARVKLRVLNQLQSNNAERIIDNWFGEVIEGWGYSKFMPLSDLRDPNKGFVVDDVLNVQVEIKAVSTTTYFP